jgi:hypothetical protein
MDTLMLCIDFCLLAGDTHLLTEYTTRLLIRRQTGKDDYTYERSLDQSTRYRSQPALFVRFYNITY